MKKSFCCKNLLVRPGSYFLVSMRMQLLNGTTEERSPYHRENPGFESWWCPLPGAQESKIVLCFQGRVEYSLFLFLMLPPALHVQQFKKKKKMWWAALTCLRGSSTRWPSPSLVGGYRLAGESHLVGGNWTWLTWEENCKLKKNNFTSNYNFFFLLFILDTTHDKSQ